MKIRRHWIKLKIYCGESVEKKSSNISFSYGNLMFLVGLCSTTFGECKFSNAIDMNPFFYTLAGRNFIDGWKNK